MSINNSIGVLPDSLRPYEAEAVEHFAVFLGIADLGRCERVCKLWNECGNEGVIWRDVSKREGISLVEGEGRDRKEDFKVLYPIFISGARISRLFGKVVGRLPCISQKLFNELNDPDLFEMGKLKKDTFVFVVDPFAVRRTAGKETPFDLDAEGNLIELPANQVMNGKELIIPFSFKNLRVLCSYPLEGKHNMPVFHEDSNDEVFNQCGASPNKINVYFMRRCIAEETRYMAYPQQENFVKERGFEVTPIRIRGLYDAVEILESGTCPDAVKPRLTYVRCSDTYCSDKRLPYVAHATIGDFAPGDGARVLCSDFGCGDIFIGVAPGVPAEVLRSFDKIDIVSKKLI